MRTSLLVFGVLLALVGVLVHNQDAPAGVVETVAIPATVETAPPASAFSAATDEPAAEPREGNCPGGVCPINSSAPTSGNVQSSPARPRWGQRVRSRVRSWRPFGGFFQRRFGGE